MCQAAAVAWGLNGQPARCQLFMLACKHLCTAAGTLGFDSLKGTLAEKQARHSLLLTALQVGGVLRQMPPSVLAALFEHAQMLQAAARVLDYQRGCEGAASDRDAASQGTALLLPCRHTPWAAAACWAWLNAVC